MRHLLTLGFLFSLSVSAMAELQVGFASVNVTPPIGDKPVYLAGFGKDRPATGVHDPIMARAIVLTDGDRKLAIVSVDVVGLFLNDVEHVREKLKDFTGVVVTSTHNHEGPDTMGLWGPNSFTQGNDPDYQNKLLDDLVEVVRQAEQQHQPTRVHIGTVALPELIRDTRDPQVKHDELVALQFLDPKNNQPQGVVVQWNNHPETLGSRNTELSADFVGYTVTELEKRQSCPVVYLTGTVGGLMTTLGVPIQNANGKSLPKNSFAKTERLGRLVGQAADQALRASRPIKLTPLTARRQSVLLPVDNPLYQMAWTIGVLRRPIYRWTGDPFVAQPERIGKPAGQMAIRSEVGHWQLGELEIAIIPGEIYPELVLDKVPDPAPEGVDFPEAPVEPGIYPAMSAKYRMLIGLGNDEIGYILPRRLWDEKPPYSYGLKKRPYGEINSLGPNTGPILCEAFRRLGKGGASGNDPSGQSLRP